jgi:hypothetical protein
MAAPATRILHRRPYVGPSCPHCGGPVPADRRRDGKVVCTACRGDFEATFFSPPRQHVQVARTAEAGPQGGQPCAKHERNLAVANCERCGNFMCNLCKIEADGMVLCPPCFDRLSQEGALPSTQKTIRNYAGMASSSLAIGLFICFVMPLCGGVGLYYCIRGLQAKQAENESEGVVTLWITLVVAVLELIGGLALAGFFIYSLSMGR